MATMQHDHAPENETDGKGLFLTKVLVEGIKKNGVPTPQSRPWMRKMNGIKGTENRIMKHQHKAVHRMLRGSQQPRFIFNHAMGAGKTVSAVIAMLTNFVMEKKAEISLIVAPKSTLIQWKDTILAWTLIKQDEILHTSKSSDITTENMQGKLVVITTPSCVVNAFKSCFQEYEEWESYVDKKGSERFRKGWGRKGMTKIASGWYQAPTGHEENFPLHAIFREFGMLILDEVHAYRGINTISNEAIKRVAKMAHKVLGLTGTLVFNKPLDLLGITTAMDIEDDTIASLKDKAIACDSKALLQVMRHMDTYTDRVGEKELALPDIFMRGVDMTLDVHDSTGQFLNYYRSKMKEAIQIRKRIESGMDNTDNIKNLADFVAALNSLQQFVVSPLLAIHGCDTFERDPNMMEMAVQPEHVTGCMKTLAAELRKLQGRGHNLIVVASDKVMPMRILMQYLRKSCAGEFGDLMLYTGSLSEAQRNSVKRDFLAAERAVLFLSIKAGGCGLDLIPNCEAMVFVGPIPFSPAAFLQCTRRIYRVGQTCERTGSVEIVCIVAHGSIDHGVCGLHFFKQSALDWVQDGIMPKSGDSTGVFVTCKVLDQAKMPVSCQGGYMNFPVQNGAFDLMPNIRVEAVNNALV